MCKLSDESNLFCEAGNVYSNFHLLLCMCNTSFPYSNHTRVLQQKPTAQVFPLCAAKVARKLFLWTRMVSLKHILFQSSVMQQGLLNIFVCFMENALFQQT